MSDDLTIRRKRLLWRATHRGTRELDLMLGGFAVRYLDSMQAAALDEFDAIVETPDPQLIGWIMRQSPVPQTQRSSTLDRLLAFRP